MCGVIADGKSLCWVSEPVCTVDWRTTLLWQSMPSVAEANPLGAALACRKEQSTLLGSKRREPEILRLALQTCASDVECTYFGTTRY